MLGLLRTMGRWVRALAALAILFMVSAAAIHASPDDHHSGVNEAKLHTCDHDPGGSQDPFPEHDSQCIATGTFALTVPAEWVPMDMDSTAVPPPIPASTEGVALVSVSPPYKPPRD